MTMTKITRSGNAPRQEDDFEGEDAFDSAGDGVESLEEVTEYRAVLRLTPFGSSAHMGDDGVADPRPSSETHIADTTIALRIARVIEFRPEGDEVVSESASAYHTTTWNFAGTEDAVQEPSEGAGAFHIHRREVAESGEVSNRGPIVLTLELPQGSAKGTHYSEDIPIDDVETVLAIVETPQLYYVNLHTREYPQGALSAQVAGFSTLIEDLPLSPEEEADAGGDHDLPEQEQEA